MLRVLLRVLGGVWEGGHCFYGRGTPVGFRVDMYMLHGVGLTSCRVLGLEAAVV